VSEVSESERADFFRAVAEASKRAVWCALATSSSCGARVRIVHPTWEGETLWFATGTTSPKVRHIDEDPRIELQYQVSPPDFVHILVRGVAKIVKDEEEKRRVWDVIDYDLSQFWSGGPEDRNYTLVRIEPQRVELSKMFGALDKRVWHAPKKKDGEKS
jgi:general stress protein 26